MKELESRVFVVDDDQSVRTSLANLLTTEDYPVETFASAAEYLARVPHPRPGVSRARREAAWSRRPHPPKSTHGGTQNGGYRLHHWAR